MTSFGIAFGIAGYSCRYHKGGQLTKYTLARGVWIHANRLPHAHPTHCTHESAQIDRFQKIHASNELYTGLSQNAPGPAVRPSCKHASSGLNAMAQQEHLSCVLLFFSNATAVPAGCAARCVGWTKFLCRATEHRERATKHP